MPTCPCRHWRLPTCSHREARSFACGFASDADCIPRGIVCAESASRPAVPAAGPPRWTRSPGARGPSRAGPGSQAAGLALPLPAGQVFLHFRRGERIHAEPWSWPRGPAAGRAEGATGKRPSTPAASGRRARSICRASSRSAGLPRIRPSHSTTVSQPRIHPSTSWPGDCPDFRPTDAMRRGAKIGTVPLSGLLRGLSQFSGNDARSGGPKMGLSPSVAPGIKTCRADIAGFLGGPGGRPTGPASPPGEVLLRLPRPARRPRTDSPLPAIVPVAAATGSPESVLAAHLLDPT